MSDLFVGKRTSCHLSSGPVFATFWGIPHFGSQWKAKLPPTLPPQCWACPLQPLFTCPGDPTDLEQVLSGSREAARAAPRHAGSGQQWGGASAGQAAVSHGIVCPPPRRLDLTASRDKSPH